MLKLYILFILDGQEGKGRCLRGGLYNILKNLKIQKFKLVVIYEFKITVESLTAEAHLRD